MLDLDVVAGYAISRGLMRAEDVAFGGFSARDVSRRNRAFVLGSKGTGVFLKQSAAGARGLATEERVLRTVATTPALEALRRHVPRWISTDGDAGTVAIELIEPATTLTRVWLNGGDRPELDPRVATVVGRALGRFHTGGGTPDGKRALMDAMPARVPYNFDGRIQYGPGPSATDVWPGGRRVLDALRTDGRFVRHAAACAASWRPVAPVHNDVRSENFLIGIGSAAHVKIIDWELAVQGEPEWDVACMLVELARFRAANTRGGGAIDIVPFARAFWRSWSRTTGSEPGDAWANVCRFLPMAFVRVALEASRGADEINPIAAGLLADVWRTLEDAPDVAQRDFGVSGGGEAP